MSRSVPQISQAIISDVQSNPILGPLLTSPSATAIYRLWAFVVATSQGIEEQLFDQFKLDVESIINSAAPMTAPWIRSQVFGWQYSVTSPQVIQLDPLTYAPSWPTVDPSLRLITRCSVTAGFLNGVNVKVAKGTTPAPLTTTELSALQSFLNNICAPGLIYNAVSTNSDKLSTAVTIYYQGVYSSVIQANLLSAYNNYLTSIPFDGTLKITDLEYTLKSVTGVNDIIINAVGARADSTLFVSRTKLVDANTEYFKDFQTISGYITDESTTGQDFLSLLTLISV